MDLDKLQELIRIFEASDLSEIEIEESGRRMRLKKPRPVAYSTPVIPMAPPQEARGTQVILHEAVRTVESALAAKPVKEEKLITIDSPMVGVFYVAPAPSEPPFVRPGDTVDEKQTVCIVEAMKLMNEVTAKFPCVIEKVLVENGEPVEYNQPLFAVRPIDQV